MAINKTELEKLLNDQGIGARTKKKILAGLDAPAEAASPRTSTGHGAAAPDQTMVPSM